MARPIDFPRRSFVYRKLEQAGAAFSQSLGWAVAEHFGDAEAERATVRHLGLADLSPLPRCGFKGAGTAEWLGAKGVRVPEQPNWATRQAGGELAVRLAATEVLVLDDVARGAGGIVDSLPAAWNAQPRPPAEPRGYPVPRADTHCWFLVTGAEAARMFAKICGVDLRAHRFADLQVAQTQAARLGVVIIRDDRGGVLAYHLLADSASAPYLWDCLLDAMAEFDGGPVGLSALRALGEA